MKRFKKTLSLTAAGVMTLMTINGLNVPVYANENIGKDLLFERTILLQTQNDTPNPTKDEKADEKIATIFGKDVMKSMLAGGEGTKVKPKKIRFEVDKDTTTEFVDQMTTKSEYELSFFKDAAFKKELKEEKDDKDKKIMIPKEDKAEAMVYVKAAKTQPAAPQQEEVYYEVTFVRKKEAPQERKLSILGTDLDLKAADATEANPKKVIIKTNKMQFERTKNDDIIKQGSFDDIGFYKDKEFKTELENIVAFPENQMVSIFVKVRFDNSKHQDDKFYELQVTREVAKQDDKDKDKDKNKDKDNQSSRSGGTSRSPVRPDGTSGSSNKSDTKNDKKTETTDKKETPKPQPQPQKPAMPPMVQNRVSTRLTIGKKTYTSMVGGVPTEKTMDVAPQVHKGRTVLPARVISEILGVEVKYDQKTKTATFIYQGTGKVQLTLGQKHMMVNGQKVALSGEVVSKEGRVLLPVADIQKAFKGIGLQANIAWDAATKSVTIEK